MRTTRSFLVFISVLFIIATTVNAGLIGVRELIDGQYPDIMFNNTGTIAYDSLSDSFVLSADDLKIAYDDSTYDWLSWPGVLTKMTIDLDIDQSGQLIRTGTMTERVVEGEIQIGNFTYGADTTILSGTVYDFGWAESGEQLGMFDFLVKDLQGALIDDLIWPSDVPTGIIAFAESLNNWDGTWDSDFNLSKVKGDKAPIIPEPATFLLLTLGAVMIRRKHS